MTKSQIIKAMEMFDQGDEVPFEILRLAQGCNHSFDPRRKPRMPWTRMRIIFVKHPATGQLQKVFRAELYPIPDGYAVLRCDLGRRLVVDTNLENNPEWSSHTLITDLPPIKESRTDTNRY